MCKPKPINPSGCGGINQSAVVANAPASQFWQHWRKSLKTNLHYIDGSFVSNTATLKPLINNFVSPWEHAVFISRMNCRENIKQAGHFFLFVRKSGLICQLPVI
jgi:hypothetical protein